MMPIIEAGHPFAGWLYEPETPAESLRVPQRFTSNYSGRKVERICGRVLHMPFAAERWSGGTLRFSHFQTHTWLVGAARFSPRRCPESWVLLSFLSMVSCWT